MMAAAVLFTVQAQDAPKSPKSKAEGKSGGVDIKIDYSAPAARERKVMGELVPFGEVWRTGANDATTITFSQNVKIEGKDLAAGTYSLFTIPGEKEWVIIFNSEVKQWGSFKYNDKKDVLRVSVAPKKTGKMVEQFTISVLGEGVRMEWENTMVTFRVKKK